MITYQPKTASKFATKIVLTWKNVTQFRPISCFIVINFFGSIESFANTSENKEFKQLTNTSEVWDPLKSY